MSSQPQPTPEVKHPAKPRATASPQDLARPSAVSASAAARLNPAHSRVHPAAGNFLNPQRRLCLCELRKRP